MGKIRVVDKSTGEYIEFDYESVEDLANQYYEVQQQLTALERAKKKMQEAVKAIIGEDKELPVNDQFRFVNVSRPTAKKFDRSYLARYLDEDQLDLVLEPSTKKTKELLETLVEDGIMPANIKGEIEANMIAEGYANYVKLEKLKR